MGLMSKSQLQRAKVWLDLKLYLHTVIFALVLLAGAWGYLQWLGLPSLLNKAVADVAALLIALSMMLGGLGYFFNVFDRQVVYRKHLGMVGFALAVWHLLLSWGAFLRLLQPQTWFDHKMWPALTGTVALVIFAVMAVISNQLAVRLLGGKWWRWILRTGYLGLVLVVAHVVLLKGARWLTWYQAGMQEPPALSLLMTAVMLLAVFLRLGLEWSLRRRRRK